MKFTFRVTIEPWCEEMGLDTPEVVKDQIEEAFRDFGLDNAANIKVELLTEEDS